MADSFDLPRRRLLVKGSEAQTNVPATPTGTVSVPLDDGPGDDRRRTRARRAASFAAGSAGRRVAGAVLIDSAALTLFTPLIVAAAPWLHPWMPYLCAVDGP